ncbi:putative transport protein YifK [Sporomusa silvacetica DSM 10669]|uniref:Transport protein YifK n=1 Tax=Sporomusa silvacetica DSM 10669 TaxID=1123289 RepID=A0ABZ3IS93_9FIRM|nr:amino acid permease [Sporomusa silvacetica]OZC20729.1 putative transport protein YifK [Sporomusa silvacetica DSM 10669]
MDKLEMAQENLHRGLHDRHIQLIAMGGVIGVGLFLGSASAIKTAGPGILLAYLLGGIIVFFIMRALGEIAVTYPVSGSFAQYATTFLGSKFGYITGWNYWYQWVVGCMCEITAVGMYMKFWYPDIEQWIPALAALACMTVVNLVAVKFYGEFEFWFALIKIIAIVGMILIGSLMILFGIGNEGVALGISNLWANGGFLPFGIQGVFMSMVMVTFAYCGSEGIGLTAGEAKDPSKTLPSAIDKVFWRVLIFYVGSLFVILSIYPWDQIGTIGSPFVATFKKLGISGAAAIINFVVVTAALSACNTGIYSSGRFLYSLALRGEAPAYFRKLNSSQVPQRGILATTSVILVGVILNYCAPAQVFVYVTSLNVSGALWTWLMILLTQLKFRERLMPDEINKLKYRMPGSPYTNWICIAYLLLVAIIMFVNDQTRIAIYLAPVWFGLLYFTYSVFIAKNSSKDTINIKH